MNRSIASGEAHEGAAGDALQRALAGDDDAFEQLILPLVPPAHRLAFALLRDRAAAEDAVQDACLSAWNRLHQLRSAESLRPWFLAIVANRCRSATRRPGRLVVGADPLAADQRPGPDATVWVLSVREALRRLPLRDQTILYLRFVEDLSQEEVARAAGVRLGTVKSRLHRALRRLRRELSEEVPHE